MSDRDFPCIHQCLVISVHMHCLDTELNVCVNIMHMKSDGVARCVILRLVKRLARSAPCERSLHAELCWVHDRVSILFTDMRKLQAEGSA